MIRGQIFSSGKEEKFRDCGYNDIGGSASTNQTSVKRHCEACQICDRTNNGSHKLLHESQEFALSSASYETTIAHPHAYRIFPETPRNNTRATLPRGNRYKNVRRPSDVVLANRISKLTVTGLHIIKVLRIMSPFGKRRSLLAFATCLSPALILASPFAAPGSHSEGLSRRGNSAKIPCGNAPKIIAGK